MANSRPLTQQPAEQALPKSPLTWYVDDRDGDAGEFPWFKG